MKSYWKFILTFVVLLLVYILAELNKPQPLNWNITLTAKDKNPNGAYILFRELKNIFRGSDIITSREPAYNLFHNKQVTGAAYIVIAPVFGAAEPDVKELLEFAARGNHVFVSALRTSKLLSDTLGLEKKEYAGFLPGDSTSLNFVNPALQAQHNYRYKRFTVDQYFSRLEKPDSTLILGVTNRSHPDFVRVRVGRGAIYVHAAPLVFSNYAMLTGKNYEYAAKALSYLPQSVSAVYWDEYYKLGRTGARTPLRFFLNDTWLGWALRLTIIALVLYVLFEMKRRQRIIPVITPLRNTTLDFVKTVSAVYLAKKDNRSVAKNKIQYWMQFVRQRYYLQTNTLDDQFIALLSRRSGNSEESIREIVGRIEEIENNPQVEDRLLLVLNHQLGKFYSSSKT